MLPRDFDPAPSLDGGRGPEVLFTNSPVHRINHHTEISANPWCRGGAQIARTCPHMTQAPHVAKWPSGLMRRPSRIQTPLGHYQIRRGHISPFSSISPASFHSSHLSIMFKALASAAASAVSSLRASPEPLGADHEDPRRIKQYAEMAVALEAADVPVSLADCAACNVPCESTEGAKAELGNAWDGKTYDDYVAEKYGHLDQLPDTVETDWESDLAGSGGPPVGRVVVISTGKSNWVRDHVVSYSTSITSDWPRRRRTRCRTRSTKSCRSSPTLRKRARAATRSIHRRTSSRRPSPLPPLPSPSPSRSSRRSTRRLWSANQTTQQTR